MSVIDILLRTISGFIWVFLLLLLWFSLCPFGKKINWDHKIGCGILGFYLIGVLVMTGIGNLGSFSLKVHLLPLEDFWNGKSQLVESLKDPFLNIILFFPLGFLLPLLYHQNRFLWRTLFTGFLFSLTIEFLQMFDRGLSDISDLLMNTLGTYLGYLAFQILSLYFKDFFKNFLSWKKLTNLEQILLFGSSLLIMITLQPWLIRVLFHFG